VKEQGVIFMSLTQSKETVQEIGKMRFVVVSQFRESGSTVVDNITRLLEREAQKKINVSLPSNP